MSSALPDLGVDRAETAPSAQAHWAAARQQLV